MAFALRLLTLHDRPRFEAAIAAMSPCRRSFLAHWAFAPHVIWRHLFKYRWTVLNGWLCLFAEYGDGVYMPLPPLGAWPEEEKGAPESWKATVAQAMEYMKCRNGGSQVTRIENIPEELKPYMEEAGYCLAPKDPDYLYRTAELVTLRGNRFKSQRAAYNRLLRTHHVRYAPYRRLDREACLAVLEQWTRQKRHPLSKSADVYAERMLDDAIGAHRLVLEHDRTLGLVGRVVWVDGVIRGYTFGFARSPEVFCVLLEVADRTMTGLPQFLFRELCREMQRYPFINTLDDAGLHGLARSKRAYRPCQVVTSYIATERERSA